MTTWKAANGLPARPVVTIVSWLLNGLVVALFASPVLGGLAFALGQVT
jgi:hypothetical protein